MYLITYYLKLQYTGDPVKCMIYDAINNQQWIFKQKYIATNRKYLNKYFV